MIFELHELYELLYCLVIFTTNDTLVQKSLTWLIFYTSVISQNSKRRPHTTFFKRRRHSSAPQAMALLYLWLPSLCKTTPSSKHNLLEKQAEDN